MKKNFSKVLLSSLMAIGLVSCGGVSSDSSSVSDNPSTADSSQPISSVPSNQPSDTSSAPVDESPIKSLSAKKENVSIKIDEQALLSNYYELKGFKSLSAKQKRVVVTSSDTNIVSINSKYTNMTAVGIGTATITVVSEIDDTKSCSFVVTVEDCYFDRTLTSVDSSWDITNEMAAENPFIRVNTNIDQGLYVRNSDGLKWYIETEITLHKVMAGELWPKIGIVANTTDNIKEKDNVHNKLYYYFDTNLNQEGQWVNFGVCEVKNIGNWAWNDGISNNVARCNYVVHNSSAPIGYNQTFKMGMVRDGFNCHLYYDGKYMTSIKVLGHIFGEYNAETQAYTDPVNCMAGFFAFNAEVTFSNYKFINDPTEVDALIPSEPTYNEQWASD